MSDNHERFQNGSGSVNGSVPQKDSYPDTTPYRYGSTYSSNPTPAQSPNPQAYTWNSRTGEYSSGPYTPVKTTPGYAPTPPVNKKRSGASFGVKLLAVALCCVLTSAATLGVFVWMLRADIVDVDPDAGQPEFTVSQTVAEDETSVPGTENTEPESETTFEIEEPVSGAVMADQDIAEKLIPSVVCIQNYQVSEQYGFMYASETDGVSPAGEGSGIVFREDGYIVTNAHVIDGATSLKVILHDGSTYEATLVGSDALTDLAVIKVDVSTLGNTKLVAADFGSSSDMRVADKVIAIGNPGGSELSSSVTIGYVSALNRAIASSTTGYTMEFIQTDAAINPGNSGGALVNSYGQVIGINSAKISATGYEGLGFAIPTDFAQPIIADLIEYGYVKDRAMLGISGQFLDSMTGRFYGLPQGEYVGALNTVNAQNSGLRAGDVIMAIDETELTSEAVLRSLINTKKPGETVILQVYRASTGETLEIQLMLSEYSGG